MGEIEKIKKELKLVKDHEQYLINEVSRLKRLLRREPEMEMEIFELRQQNLFLRNALNSVTNKN